MRGGEGKEDTYVTGKIITAPQSYGLPRWHSVVKNPPAYAGDIGDVGSIPGSGRFPGERNGNPL